MTFTNTQTKLGQAITTNASGDYAVRTIIEGDQTLENLTLTGDLNGGGGHILNEQTTTNMMSKGTVYRFDGVNDKVVSGTSTEFAYDGTTPFSLFAQFNTSDTTQDAPIVGLWQSASAAAADIISLDIVAGVLKFYVIKAWSGQFIRFTTTDSFADDKNHIAIATYDGSGSSSGLAVYVDGVLCVGSADANGSIATFTATNTFGVANNAKWGSATFFCGEIGRYGIFNLEATAAEVKNIISGNIPFKWQYGSQTAQTSGTLEIGQAYIIDDWITADDFTNVGGLNVDGTVFVATGTTPTTWTNSSSLRPLGAVALYDQTSISETTWYDKANGNDGAVTGASVLNQPVNDTHKGIVVNGGFLNIGAYTTVTIASGVITIGFIVPVGFGD